MLCSTVMCKVGIPNFVSGPGEYMYNGGRICYIKNHGFIVFILSYTPWLLRHGCADEQGWHFCRQKVFFATCRF